jgi:flagellar basal-body rod modification protein FlgD
MASSVNSILSSTSNTSSSSVGNAYDNMDMQDFIKLLITELQNQDPTSPVDNSEILQQLSQIKSIESNDRLSSTLTSLQYQQALVTAGSLLQRTVAGLTDDGTQIAGKVDSVSIENQEVYLHIGNSVVPMKNLSTILPQT